VRLKRRGPRDGHIERFRRRLVEPEAKVVRGKLIAWARHNVKTLREACPELPETLTDRQQDCLEPLLAIADSAGRNWGEWARQSVSQVFAETRTDESSIRVKLLFDIRNVFDGRKVVRLTSHEMVDLLCGIETAQWADFKNGQNLSVNELAKMLRPFDIAPRTIRVGKQTSKGYTRMSFVDSWERYLGPYAKLSVSCPNREPLQPSQPSTLAGFGSNSEASQASLVAS
jgi:hypothetical protein